MGWPFGCWQAVSHPSIRAYLKCIGEEQAQARVHPRKVTLLFSDKFSAIVGLILSKLRDPKT